MKSTSKFITIRLVATLWPPFGGLTREPLARVEPRRMTRCECSGTAFAEVARLLRGGLSLEQACDRTGCGRTCGACLPDLQYSLRALPKR